MAENISRKLWTQMWAAQCVLGAGTTIAVGVGVTGVLTTAALASLAVTSAALALACLATIPSTPVWRRNTVWAVSVAILVGTPALFALLFWPAEGGGEGLEVVATLSSLVCGTWALALLATPEVLDVGVGQKTRKWPLTPWGVHNPLWWTLWACGGVWGMSVLSASTFGLWRFGAAAASGAVATWLWATDVDEAAKP